jgi:hypothetical protein
MSCATASADLQKGLDAYNAGDYATALEELRPLADRGNADKILVIVLYPSTIENFGFFSNK